MERKIIYQVESGSHMYGTATWKSDKDYTSVFLPTAYDLLSLQKCDYIDESTKNSSSDRRNTSDDVDNQQHSLNRYVSLVLGGNPNLTEILFCESPIIEEPVFTKIKRNRELLISDRVYDSFTDFAISQKKKLEYKSKRFGQLVKSLEHLEKEYPTTIVDPAAQMKVHLASWLNENLSEYKGDKHNRQSFHEGLPVKTVYEKIKSECENYGWRVKTDTFTTLGYDVKFAAHAIRLFHEGKQLMLTGRLEFPITGQALDDIMAVRRGQVSIEGFYELCSRYEEENRKAHENSILPKHGDWKWANEMLVDVLTEAICKEYLDGRQR